MVVNTLSENAIKGREDVMEFLLVNHPLDCPICDEAGQCKLQDYAFEHSRGESRFDEAKNHKDKRVPLGPNVLFDAERCISCSRCIRFAAEVAEQPVLTFVVRGDHVSIISIPEECLDNNMSMNVIDICPVGALTSRDFRFKARVWDMSFTDSVCPGCSRNCSIRVGVRNNEILRLEPRNNPNVNSYWMCDHGRLNAYPPVNEERISGPLMRDGRGVQIPTNYEAAARATADALKKYSKDEVLILGSALATLEDNYAMFKLAHEKFGKHTIPFIPHVSGEDERLMLRADKTPNSTGARMLGLTADNGQILEQLRSRKIKAVYALEDNFLADPQLLEAFEHVEFFACHSPNHGVTSRRADVVFSCSAWAEQEGTYVNFEGWTQNLRPAVTTTHQVRGMDHLNMSRLDRFGTPFDSWARGNKREAREGWRFAQLVANELGAHWKYLYTEDVFEDLAGSVKEFKGMTYESIGHLGQPVAGSKSLDVKEPIYKEVYQDSTERIESVGSVML
jgi:NADH-quinone oxidoreductase subunit G